MEKERDTLDLPPSSDLGPLGQPVSLHFLQALPVLLCMWLKVSNRKKRTDLSCSLLTRTTGRVFLD